jgi:hypothetical protein
MPDSLTPSHAHEGQHRFSGFLLRLGPGTLLPADGKTSEKNQMRNAFRMSDGVSDRNCATLRYAEEGESINACGIDNRFEVIHELFKCDVRDLTIRQPVPSSVVSEEGMIARQFPVKMPPDRTFKIKFDVGHPMPGFNERETLAYSGVGKLHAIPGLAEMYFLFVPDGWCRSVFSR